MAQKVYDLGPVCPIYKGNWSATATYETLNMVRHGTALWVMIAKTYTVGSTPSDSSSFWKRPRRTVRPEPREIREPLERQAPRETKVNPGRRRRSQVR